MTTVFASRFTARGYDQDGRETFVSYPQAFVDTVAEVTLGTRTLYDALGRTDEVRQDSELGVLSTNTEYLPGFQVRVTTPRGHATTTAYLAYDEPSTEWPKSITHPVDALTYIDRDVLGRPTMLTRRNTAGTVSSSRSYVYDGGDLCKVIEPETGATVLHHDAAGNLDWSATGLTLTGATTCDYTGAQSSGRVASRGYDGRNRLTSLSFPDGLGNQTWVWYPTGKPQSVTTLNGTGGNVTNSYVFNKRGLLTSETQAHDINTWTLSYGYNANGHPISLVYPAGLTVNQTVNALGQVTGVTGTTPFGTTTYASGASYHPNGALKQFTYGNGLLHTLTQNLRGLPDRSKDVYGTSVIALDDSYAYDGNGNVAAISDGRIGGRGNRTMTYDGLDRLETTTSPMFNGTVATYAYDALDNLTHVVAPGRDSYYCYNSKWQLDFVRTLPCNGGAATTALTYDVQGNLASKNAQNYVFDYGNRLRSATNVENYRYDAHGRRVLAEKPTGGKIFSLYSNDGSLLWTRDERASKRIQYVYLAGSLVAQRSRPIGTDVETLTYQHTDALGSPVAVTNTSRGIVETSEFEPYGKLLNRPLTDGPGYTGHVSDAATGLSYMQQRYYDPGIGRFLSMDPVSADSASGGNFNRYWYANNNPYKFTDPDAKQGAGPECEVTLPHVHLRTTASTTQRPSRQAINPHITRTQR